MIGFARLTLTNKDTPTISQQQRTIITTALVHSYHHKKALRVQKDRCLFTLGATAIWKKEDFINAEQLGGGIRPDLAVAQMEIDKEVVETIIETAGTAGIEFCLNAAPTTPINKRLY